ncbi:uncharacterized protein [Onthophagus taurus]|uniref:uncharacterized protein isoform X1 n=2 Tax=Onthophagus taurus TaxID=166361 RepID=UPI0039BE8ED0
MYESFFIKMSQDGFSQIDLTAPGFASSQESFLLNSFDINLLNISTVEKALDPNVQPNEQPMDPNVESNAQQDPSLLNVAGSANVDDKNVKRLSLRRNSGNREHWKKAAGVWVPSEKYREERREARARSRRSQRKYVSVEQATPSKVEMTQSKVVTENESDKSDDSLALMAVSQHCSNRKYLKATKASFSSSKASLAPVTNSNIPNTEIPSLSPKVHILRVDNIPANIPATSDISDVSASLFSNAMCTAVETTKGEILAEINNLYQNFYKDLHAKVLQLQTSLRELSQFREGLASSCNNPLTISLDITIASLTCEIKKAECILSSFTTNSVNFPS